LPRPAPDDFDDNPLIMKVAENAFADSKGFCARALIATHMIASPLAAI
jgi:hypothetical protein